jgi:hypothetical protein
MGWIGQNQLPKVIKKVIKAATVREGAEVVSQARSKSSPKITPTSKREPSHADIASMDKRWDW